MASCYVIFSESIDKYYVGSTRETVEQRLKKHNENRYGNQAFTFAANDWHIYLEIAATDYSHALRIERKIKSMKSRIFINNLKKYPELVRKIVEQTRR